MLWIFPAVFLGRIGIVCSAIGGSWALAWTKTFSSRRKVSLEDQMVLFQNGGHISWK
jgi:hypothetical protein